MLWESVVATLWIGGFALLAWRLAASPSVAAYFPISPTRNAE